jgi:hypothetical protein
MPDGTVIDYFAEEGSEGSEEKNPDSETGEGEGQEEEHHHDENAEEEEGGEEDQEKHHSDEANDED